MPVTKSPLRYPGGKTQLSNFIGHLIDVNYINNVVYCEPFSGGAGAAVELLLTEKVSKIILNDYDIGIYSIWYAILNQPDDFINEIRNIEITIDEWYNQKSIYKNMKKYGEYSFELAFATFFLNRTNRSGIIAGGPIGGFTQKAKDKIDCRFNKETLINKVISISERREDILLFNFDAVKLIDKVILQHQNDNLFIFFDPPYYKQGKNLYTNFFEYKDHQKLANKIKSIKDYYWITTYDYEEDIKELYNGVITKEYYLRYSANRVRKEKEYLFHNNKTIVESWDVVTF
ncbi:DNA adenine methylase [Oceanobacillus oncorhynchi]|uniref:DNA adenine methylase n=1 Tax=Oceanobacillus oncorhynchi TaxID=545501 RepID=UPI0025A47824|nr:DNA adenine methylase [Oceanobacillus oncorhynchi]MDM8101258.1 DNA adenine methylase [Oceanobacillus oncorhynchi]